MVQASMLQVNTHVSRDVVGEGFDIDSSFDVLMSLDVVGEGFDSD